uniref:Uncharacterized protein n=1 Tax=Opuntia streptacantha TaxID=393608 RepID=A0A7C8Z1D7_OPUST
MTHDTCIHTLPLSPAFSKNPSGNLWGVNPLSGWGGFMTHKNATPAAVNPAAISSTCSCFRCTTVPNDMYTTDPAGFRSSHPMHSWSAFIESARTREDPETGFGSLKSGPTGLIGPQSVLMWTTISSSNSWKVSAKIQNGFDRFLNCPRIALLRTPYGVVGWRKDGISSHLSTGMEGIFTSM